jgi:hypothetical protein
LAYSLEEWDQLKGQRTMQRWFVSVWSIVVLAAALAACGAADNEATVTPGATAANASEMQVTTSTGPSIALNCPSSVASGAVFTCEVELASVSNMAPYQGYSITILHSMSSLASVPDSWSEREVAFPGGVLEVFEEYNLEPDDTVPGAGSDHRVTMYLVASFPLTDVSNMGSVATVDFECRSDGTHRLRLVPIQDVNDFQSTFTAGPDSQPQANTLTNATVACGDAAAATPEPDIDAGATGGATGADPAEGVDPSAGSDTSADPSSTQGQTGRDADAAARTGASAGLGDLGEGGGSSTLDRSGVAVLVAVLAAIGVAFAVAAPFLRRRLRARGPAGE